MSKRMSLAPSVIMAPGQGGPDEPPERGSGAKDFICSHVKTIVTIFMIFGTVAVIVLIVMGEYSLYLSCFTCFMGTIIIGFYFGCNVHIAC